MKVVVRKIGGKSKSKIMTSSSHGDDDINTKSVRPGDPDGDQECSRRPLVAVDSLADAKSNKKQKLNHPSKNEEGGVQNWKERCNEIVQQFQSMSKRQKIERVDLQYQEDAKVESVAAKANEGPQLTSNITPTEKMQQQEILKELHRRSKQEELLLKHLIEQTTTKSAFENAVHSSLNLTCLPTTDVGNIRSSTLQEDEIRRQSMVNNYLAQTRAALSLRNNQVLLPDLLRQTGENGMFQSPDELSKHAIQPFVAPSGIINHDGNQEYQSDSSIPNPNRLCQFRNCKKLIVSGGLPFCTAHGGGICCQYPGCETRARPGGTKYCTRHGGGRRCLFEGCHKGSASGGTQYCIAHGGGRRCQYQGCEKGAQGGSKSRYCRNHGKNFTHK